MKVTQATLDEMRRRAAIDRERTDNLVRGLGEQASRPFNEYITVTEVCDLTGSTRGQLYYALNQATVSLPGARHVLWFIHVDDAINYAGLLKERRLRRAGNLAAAAARLERRNARRLDRAKRVSDDLDRHEKSQEQPARSKYTPRAKQFIHEKDGMVSITRAGEILGLSMNSASALIKRRNLTRKREGGVVYVPIEEVEALQHDRPRHH